MKYRSLWVNLSWFRGCRVTPTTSNVLVSIRLKLHVCTSHISYLPCFAITWSEHMRVAHSGTSNLKNLPNFPKIDPCSEPWKRVTFVVRNWIFIVPTLHARSYLSCKNQRSEQLTFVTLTCQSQVEYRWNTGPAGQFVLILGVPCYTYNFKYPVSIRLKLHVCTSM